MDCPHLVSDARSSARVDRRLRAQQVAVADRAMRPRSPRRQRLRELRDVSLDRGDRRGHLAGRSHVRIRDLVRAIGARSFIPPKSISFERDSGNVVRNIDVVELVHREDHVVIGHHLLGQPARAWFAQGEAELPRGVLCACIRRSAIVRIRSRRMPRARS